MIRCKKGQPQEICHDNGGNFMGRERIMRSCKTLESPTDSWISATEMNGVDIQYTSRFPPWWSVGVLHTNSKESPYSTSKGANTSWWRTSHPDVRGCIHHQWKNHGKGFRWPKGLQPQSRSVKFGSCALVKEDQYPSRWHQLQSFADVFWCCCFREYLPSPHQRQNCNSPMRKFAVGCIVQAWMRTRGVPEPKWWPHLKS